MQQGSATNGGARVGRRAPVDPFAGDLDSTLCIAEEQVVADDNTVRFERRILQTLSRAIAATSSRPSSALMKTRTDHWRSSTGHIDGSLHRRRDAARPRRPIRSFA